MHERGHDSTADTPFPTLLPWESPLYDEVIPEYFPPARPSSLHELQRLAQVKAGGEIGSLGPVLAALALERPDQSISPELRKYEAIFGRDSERVALDVMPVYPLLMHATIHTLASQQGYMTYAAREEEDGRIIHEHRAEDDPVAQKLTRELGWEWPYYGSVDATPQFMHCVHQYLRFAPGGENILNEKVIGRDGIERTIGVAYAKALMWVENKMNANPEGFIEYKAAIPHGIENQVWRDSPDAYFHKDGTLANHSNGIASVEVQQLAYDALLEAADIYKNEFNDREKSLALKARAETLRQQIIKYFWVEKTVDDSGDFFALGCDRDENGALRKMEVRTSNMGHLLKSRLLVGEAYRPYREKIILHLFSPEMLNVSGIRTLASDEIRFRPGAYHNGSVWLWDTYYIAEGLRYHGYYGLANHLAQKIHTVFNVTQKFPEYVRGDNRPFPSINTRIVDVWDEQLGKKNCIEQPPQEVQAWSVAADVARQHYSGIVADGAYEARNVLFEDPLLALLNGQKR